MMLRPIGIRRPADKQNDYREGTYTPSVTAASGTFTTLGAISGWFVKDGGICNTQVSGAITTAGTAAGGMLFTAPFTATKQSLGAGRETQATGAMLQASVAASSSSIFVDRYDDGSVIASGRTAVAQLAIRCA